MPSYECFSLGKKRNKMQCLLKLLQFDSYLLPDHTKSLKKKICDTE